MWARRSGRGISLLIALGAGLVAASLSSAVPSSAVLGAEAERAGLPRFVSLNPSLTAIVVALGREGALVGVDDYSAKVVPSVGALPQVGGLFDPSVETILALAPDRVLLVAGVDQQSHAARLSRVGIETEIFENESLGQVLENIARLGRLLGRANEADVLVRRIRDTRRAVARAARGRTSPTVLAIVDRSPLFLVGGATFLDEMLEAVGARNLARALGAGYPRGSIEWMIDAKPELLLDMTPGTVGALAYWSRWSSLPAVRSGRVVSVEASRISLPGPDLADALRELATIVHGPSIEAEIDQALTGLPPASAPTEEHAP